MNTRDQRIGENLGSFPAGAPAREGVYRFIRIPVASAANALGKKGQLAAPGEQVGAEEIFFLRLSRSLRAVVGTCFGLSASFAATMPIASRPLFAAVGVDSRVDGVSCSSIISNS